MTETDESKDVTNNEDNPTINVSPGEFFTLEDAQTKLPFAYLGMKNDDGTIIDLMNILDNEECEILFVKRYLAMITLKQVPYHSDPGVPALFMALSWKLSKLKDLPLFPNIDIPKELNLLPSNIPETNNYVTVCDYSTYKKLLSLTFDEEFFISFRGHRTITIDDFKNRMKEFERCSEIWKLPMIYCQLLTKKYPRLKKQIRINGWIALQTNLIRFEKEYLCNLNGKTVKMIKDGIEKMKSFLLWSVIHAFLKDNDRYRLMRDYFALRYEFYGLTLINLFTRISIRLEIPTLIDLIDNPEIYPLLIKLFYSYIFYVVCHPENHQNGKTTRLSSITCPDITYMSAETGRFCRLFSNSYLPWCTVRASTKVSSLLMGGTDAVDGKVKNKKMAGTRLDPELFEKGKQVVTKYLDDKSVAYILKRISELR